MINKFETESQVRADAATVIYAIYRSRNRERGPSGLDMWGQIERFIRVSAKRSNTLGIFIDKFKKKMACDTINPRYAETDNESGMAQITPDGSILVKDDKNKRSFMISILESDADHQKKVIDALYKETQLIVLLVRSRLENEKQYVEVK